jgi:hypothetical protein
MPRTSKNALGSETTLIGFKVSYATERALVLMCEGDRKKIGSLIKKWINLFTFPLILQATLLELKNSPSEESKKRLDQLNRDLLENQKELIKLSKACDKIQSMKEVCSEIQNKLEEYKEYTVGN